MNVLQLSTFAQDVAKGLSQEQYSIPSKYFYDEIGDGLFMEIMRLPEYYLTRAEMDIFSNQQSEIVKALGIQLGSDYQIIELGAGDGTKTMELLNYLEQGGHRFDYLPVDISAHALDVLERRFQQHIPNVKVQKMVGDYFKVLEDLQFSAKPKIVLFLGSNLGNMLDREASAFLSQLSKCLNQGDKVLIGLDMIKNADVVLPAYDDKKALLQILI